MTTSATYTIEREGAGAHQAGHVWHLRIDGAHAGTFGTKRQAVDYATERGAVAPVCGAVMPATGADCGRPAKGRLFPGNGPVCGVHLRAHESRGGESRPL